MSKRIGKREKRVARLIEAIDQTVARLDEYEPPLTVPVAKDKKGVYGYGKNDVLLSRSVTVELKPRGAWRLGDQGEAFGRLDNIVLFPAEREFGVRGYGGLFYLQFTPSELVGGISVKHFEDVIQYLALIAPTAAARDTDAAYG